jgi:MoaA/NifB/PqqE/SkfB family radical SAM enzyme
MFDLGFEVAKKLVFALGFKVRKKLILAEKPRYINFAITYKCNSRCLMCQNWRRYLNDPAKASQELTLNDLEKFISGSRQCLSELKHIGIAGGEPFLRDDLVEVVKLFRKEMPLVSLGIQTNGLLPELIGRRLKEIKKIYPDVSLAVSLDGEEKNHDLVRGVKGAYKKVVKTIEKAKELGISEISVGMTVTDKNYQDIKALKALTRKMGVSFSFYPADSGDYYNTVSCPSISDKARKALIDSLGDEKANYFSDNLRRRLQGEDKRSLPCYSGLTSFVLDPYGELKPCVLRSESFGNIKEGPLEKVLKGEKAKRARQKINPCRSCWSICEVTSSAVIDPWDVLCWFIFKANKAEFIRDQLSRQKKIAK